MAASALGFAALGVPRVAGAIVTKLSTGADARVTNPGGRLAVVCVNGGAAREVPGTWSSTLEWLVGRLAPDFPGLSFLEVRYRIKSWKRLDWCIEDCRAAIALAVGERCRGGGAAGLLDGRRGRGRVGRRPPRLDRDRAGSVDSRSARRLHARRPPPRDRARLPRPLAARHPGRQPEELAPRLRADPPAGDRRDAHDRLGRAPRARGTWAWRRPRQASPCRPLGEAGRGRARAASNRAASGEHQRPT